MSQKALLDVWTVGFIPLERSEFINRSNTLTQALSNRPSISQIKQLGYIMSDDTNTQTQQEQEQQSESKTTDTTDNNPTEDNNNISNPTEINENETETENENKNDYDIALGDYVELLDGIRGSIRFIGETEFAKGELLGIEMFTSTGSGGDGDDRDGNDGTKNDKKYFECKPGYGHWTRREKIKTHSKTIPENINELELQTEKDKQIEKQKQEENNNKKTSYLERFSSISDWKIPKQLMDEAKRLDEEAAANDSNELIDESIREDGVEVNVSIGDRIITCAELEGIIRYKGTVHFDDRIIIGIELDKWIPTGHNGTVNGTKYFNCIEGRGYFILPGGIKENKGATISREKKRRKSSILMNVNVLHNELITMSDLKADEHKEELTNIKRQIAKIEKKLHEIIILEEKRKQGEVIDNAMLTKMDRKKHLKDKLAELTKQMMDINKANEVSGPKAPLPQINFNVGDRVRLERGKTGIVKFIGETEFAKGEVIGLELDTWTPAGHNGTVRGKIYFNAQEGRGYFTRRSNILNVVLPLVKPLQKKRLSIKYKLNPLNVGDKVKIVAEDKTVNTQLCGRTGVIKYKGYPSFASGEVIGIELDKWCKNAHNGVIQGEIIFNTHAGRGIFVRRDEIEKYDPEREKLEEIKKNLKLGDTVILTNNRKGHVKYIGPVTGYDEMIGVELESWSPEAKDGRYDGFRYFTAPDGRGIFIKRNAIIDVVPLEAIQQNTGSKGANSIIVEDEDMDGDSIMSGDNVPDDMNDHQIQPKVGNRIKLTKGRFGVIMGVDEMDDSTMEYAVNIYQLIDRTLLQGKQVDIAHKRQHSHGGAYNVNINKGPKSTRQSGLLDIEDIRGGKQLMGGLVDDDSDNYDSDDDNYTALGETIELRSGKIGTIRFIGPVHFAKGNWIGVELHDHFGPHDGAVRGVRYFTCPPKRGIFVKQIRGRKKDDLTRQHLKRRCPECYGEFIKKRDPRAAYKTVGIVCDGCNKHGNEFSSNDWYFQCGQCEQTDFCLKCMLKLPIVDSDDMLDSYQNIRAKLKSTNTGTEWIFEDIHEGDNQSMGSDDDGFGGDEQKTSKFQHAPIKNIFDYFDTDGDGILTENNINDLYKASRNELDKNLFDVQSDKQFTYQVFESIWKDISPAAAQNILEWINISPMNENNKNKKAGDNIDMLERWRDIFDFFDSDMDGVLSSEDIETLLLLIGSENGNGIAFEKDKSYNFISFIELIHSTPTSVLNVICTELINYIQIRIEDVYNIFMDQKKQIMNQYSIKSMYIETLASESAWRGKFIIPTNLELFIANWFSIEIDEQHCILNETSKRINRRLMNVFNHFDWDDKGTLNTEQINEIFKIMGGNIKMNKYFQNNNSNNISFDSFKIGIKLLKKSITTDILPNLEEYIRKQNPIEELIEEEKKEVEKEQQEEEEQEEVIEEVVNLVDSKDETEMTNVSVIKEKEKEKQQPVVSVEKGYGYKQQWNIHKSFVDKLLDELEKDKDTNEMNNKCIHSFNNLITFFDGVIGNPQQINNNQTKEEKPINNNKEMDYNQQQMQQLQQQQAAEIEQLKQRNNDLMNALKALQTQLSNKTKTNNNLHNERENELNQLENNLQMEKNELENMRNELTNKENILRQEENKLNQLKQEINNSNQMNMNELNELKFENQKLNQENQKYKQILNDKQNEIQQFNQQKEIDIQNIIEEYKEKDIQINQKINILNEQNTNLKNENVQLKEIENELKEDVKALRNSKYRLINSTSAEIDALRHKIKMYTDRNWNGLISPLPK